MRIRVSDIRDEGIHIKSSENPEWLENIPELWSGEGESNLKSGIDIDIKLTKVLREVNVVGIVSMTVLTPCSRCLEEVELLVAPEVRLTLTPSDKLDSEEEDEEHETYAGEEVDLSDYIRSVVALAMPYKVICSEGCRGLCPECGINLNESGCSCEKERIDPRFAVLKNLKV